MTRPRTIHAVAPGKASGHRPDPRCVCGPSEAVDLLEPSTLVIVHRPMPVAVPADVRRGTGR
jgi:hypothetical protein